MTQPSLDSRSLQWLQALLLATLATLLLGWPARPAHAQADRPPVRILVGFPAGGTIDLVARILAEQLKDDLGATVIVESKPGAGGQLAAQALKQAAPDGRTLLLSPDHTMVMLPLSMKTAGFVPLVDFAPVAQVARYPGALAVTNAVKAASLNEFFSWSRANPGQANVGVPAPGSIPQFLVHLMAQQSGTALQSVPYRGSAPKPAHGSPGGLAQLVRNGVAFWEPVVKASGWVPQ